MNIEVKENMEIVKKVKEILNNKKENNIIKDFSFMMSDEDPRIFLFRVQITLNDMSFLKKDFIKGIYSDKKQIIQDVKNWLEEVFN